MTVDDSKEHHFQRGTQINDSRKHELDFGCSYADIRQVKLIPLVHDSVEDSTRKFNDRLSRTLFKIKIDGDRGSTESVPMF